MLLSLKTCQVPLELTNNMSVVEKQTQKPSNSTSITETYQISRNFAPQYKFPTMRLTSSIFHQQWKLLKLPPKSLKTFHVILSEKIKNVTLIPKVIRFPFGWEKVCCNNMLILWSHLEVTGRLVMECSTCCLWYGTV